MAAVDLIFQYIQEAQTLLLYTWPFIILVFLFILKFKWKNWPLEAVIIERRGTNLIKTNDRIGRYTDPYTHLTGYKLLKAKDTIPIVNFDAIIHNVAVHTTVLERFVNLLRGNIGTIFLFKYGSKQYKPIQITQNGKVKKVWREIKTAEGNPRLVQVYEQFDPRKQLANLEFEVIDWDNMNFMVQEQRASLERRQKKNKFWKEILLPLVAWAVTGLVCIILIKFSYDYAVAMKGSTLPAQQNQPATRPNIPVVNDLIPAS